MNLHDVCDYVIVRLAEGGEKLNHLKLQKLMYYIQAWHLAFYGRALFAGKFQAWIHGPVSRELYDRFVESKSLYSTVGREDVRAEFDQNSIPDTARAHIDSVLEVYAPMTDSQLEDMAHEEDPWMEARRGYAVTQRCEAELSEKTMKEYYAKRYKSKTNTK